MSQNQTVIDATTGREVTLRQTREIAPGVFAGGIPADCIPRLGFFSLKRNADGTYLPVFLAFASTIRVTRQIGKDLGIAPEEGQGGPESIYWLIRRLIHAGMVRAHRTSAHSYRLDLASFWKFWQECAQPGFWTPERIERFKEAKLVTRDAREEGES